MIFYYNSTLHHSRYYEFEVLTTGYMKVGWAKVCSEPCVDLGTDGNSYVFDGYVVSIR